MKMKKVFTLVIPEFPRLSMSVDYSRHVAKATPRAIVEAAWAQTGRNLGGAMTKFGESQKNDKKVKAAA